MKKRKMRKNSVPECPATMAGFDNNVAIHLGNIRGGINLGGRRIQFKFEVLVKHLGEDF